MLVLKEGVYHCPACRGTAVGRIGTSRYFCADCYLEFSYNKNNKPVFYYNDPSGISVVRIPGKIGRESL